MNKFMVIVFKTNNTLQRIWASNEIVNTLLNNPNVTSVYRPANEQVAELSPYHLVVWRDLEETKLTENN